MKKEKRRKKKKQPQQQEQEIISSELEKYRGYEMLLDIEDDNLEGDDDPLPMPTGLCFRGFSDVGSFPAQFK